MPARNAFIWQELAEGGVEDGLESLADALTASGWLWPAVKNSLILSSAVALISTIIGLAASFYFAFYSTYRSYAKHIGIGLIASRFLPSAAMVGGLYFLLQATDLIDTLWGLIIVYTIPGLALAILVLTPLISTIPKSHFEQAQVEGLNTSAVLIRVIIPDSWKILVFTSLLCFSLTWNEFYFASIFAHTPDSQPLSMLVATSVGQYRIDYNALALGGLISMAPIIPALVGIGLLADRD